MKFAWQISYPPANGASLGSYFPIMAVFRAKICKQKMLYYPNLHTFFEMVLIFEFMRDKVKRACIRNFKTSLKYFESACNPEI